MEKRIRSPNYPALSLPEAVEKIHMVYRAQHTHGAPREVVVKGMGYAGLNGASATAVSALAKYGLLQREGDEWSVSERAMRIIAPHSPEEKAAAIREAAHEPQLFNEIADKFPDRMPSEDVLRNYLVRKGFAPGALSSVISAYKETSEMVERDGGAYNMAHVHHEEDQKMMPSSAPSIPGRDMALPSAPLSQINELERQVGRYDFEGGQYVRILATNDVDTEEALEMIETMVALKRKELARKKRAAIVVPAPDNVDAENTED